MRTSIVAGVAATSATFFALISPGQAVAADTIATFTIATGNLSITASETANLAMNGSAAVGTIPEIKVTDDRRGTSNWTAYVSGNRFGSRDVVTGVFHPLITTTIYRPDNATVSGTASVARVAESTVPTVTPATSRGQAIQNATGIVGANTATWSASLTVNLPANVLAGNYSGTITHSVA